MRRILLYSTAIQWPLLVHMSHFPFMAHYLQLCHVPTQPFYSIERPSSYTGSVDGLRSSSAVFQANHHVYSGSLALCLTLTWLRLRLWLLRRRRLWSRWRNCRVPARYTVAGRPAGAQFRLPATETRRTGHPAGYTV